MAIDVITTILTPAESYDLTSLANVKLDLGVPTGTAFTTSGDTASGQVLPFAATYSIGKGQQASGPNIAPGSTVQLVGPTSVTLSSAVLGDVPAGSSIIFGDDVAADAFLTRAITLSSTAVQNYCGIRFAVETLQDQFNFIETRNDRQNVNSSAVLQLSKGPGCLQPANWMFSVTSVTVNESGTPVTLTEGTDFIVDMNKAQLIRLCSFTNQFKAWCAEQTTVIYVAGYTTIPADIDDACSRMTKKAFWARGRDPSIMEQSQGGIGNTKYWVTASPDGNLPPEICDILDKYRLPVIA